MKKLLVLLLAMMLVFSVAHAEEAAVTYVQPIKAVAISEVVELGQSVSAVAIELPSEAAAGTLYGMFGAWPVSVKGLDPTTFEVVDLAIKTIYVNDSMDLYDAQMTGKYLIIDLEDTLTCVANATRLESTLQVTWTSDIALADGTAIAAGSITTTEDVSWLLDDFLAGTAVDPDGREFGYRFYVPELVEGETYPMFVFLHGGGETGTDNFMQLSANASAMEFVTPEAQAVNPCFVLAPQSPAGGWPVDGIKNLIDELMAEYPIDGARISVSGLSYGSMGTTALVTKYPEIFAAAVPVAGGSFTADQYDLIKGKGIWMLIALDDGASYKYTAREGFEAAGIPVAWDLWDGMLRGDAQDVQTWEFLAEAEESGAEILFSYYIDGTTLFYPHFSWCATYSNSVFREWILSQAQEVPYVPAA